MEFPARCQYCHQDLRQKRKKGHLLKRLQGNFRWQAKLPRLLAEIQESGHPHQHNLAAEYPVLEEDYSIQAHLQALLQLAHHHQNL